MLVDVNFTRVKQSRFRVSLYRFKDVVFTAQVAQAMLPTRDSLEKVSVNCQARSEQRAIQISPLFSPLLSLLFSFLILSLLFRKGDLTFPGARSSGVHLLVKLRQQFHLSSVLILLFSFFSSKIKGSALLTMLFSQLYAVFPTAKNNPPFTQFQY